MKNSKISRWTAAVLSIIMLFSACSTSSQQDKTETSADKSNLELKVVTKTEQGYGGPVTVTLTLQNDKITECEIVGDDETEGIGSKAVEELPAKIVTANSADVDVISGATFTSKAIISAAGKALAEAKGEEIETSKVKMTPGTYTAKAAGYGLTLPISVDVKVNETSIVDIKVDTENSSESKPMLADTIELLIPRMLDYQSVAVDSITGATATSNGIKQATTDALEQAIKSAGTDPGAIEVFKAIPPKLDIHEEIDTDVLVVGMGNSGLIASLSIAENLNKQADGDSSKVNMLAIDKAGRIAGTGMATGDILAVNPPRMMEEFNNGEKYVDEKVLWDVWMDFCKNDPKESVLKMFFDESGKAVDWANYDQGFSMGEPKEGFTVDDVYLVKHQLLDLDYGDIETEVAKLHYHLLDSYEKYGGEYILETEAYELLYDESTGAVTGVKARNNNGTEYTINANAVVLATEGFIGNPDMQVEYLSNEYFPLKGVWKAKAMMQNDGKMIKQAIDLGAGTYNIGMPPMVHVAGGTEILRDYEVHFIDGVINPWTEKTATWSLNDVPIIMTTAPNTLQLDTTGKRFCNEAGIFEWWRAGPKFYTIWSEDQVNDIEKNGFKYNEDNPFIGQGGIPEGQPVPEIKEVIETCIEKGSAYKVDTLEEAEKLTGMKEENMKATLSTYNAAYEKGADDEFGKDPEYLEKINENGPFYVFCAASYPYSTCGGLDINDRLQVVKEDGVTPIKGLYAVGTDSMGTLYSERNSYVTFGGAAQGWCVTSGKVVGETLVDDLVKQGIFK